MEIITNKIKLKMIKKSESLKLFLIYYKTKKVALVLFWLKYQILKEDFILFIKKRENKKMGLYNVYHISHYVILTNTTILRPIYHQLDYVSPQCLRPIYNQIDYVSHITLYNYD